MALEKIFLAVLIIFLLITLFWYLNYKNKIKKKEKKRNLPPDEIYPLF